MNTKDEPTSVEKINNPDGSYINKIVYTKPNKNGWLSEIEVYDSNDRYLGRSCYNDNNFTDLGLTETNKYNPDGSYIQKRVYAKPDKNESWLCLREYEKPKNKIYSEITKFDKEHKIVYLKQYKFKGLLAKIIFWFAR